MAELVMEVALTPEPFGYPDHVANEIADVYIVLCHLASVYGVDINQAVEKKMSINKLRDWDVSNGVGYHK